jgi:hypothetical protein
VTPRTLPKLPIIGYRKDGRPIFPIMGGEDSPTAEQQAAAAVAAQAAADAAKNTGPVEATDEHGVGLGFPKDTAVADMKVEERANYWRAESKKQQAKVPSNLAELQEAKRKWDEFQASQQTPAEQQIQQVRAETEARVREETNKDAVVALLRTSLHTAGKNTEEIDDLIGFVDPSKFLDGEKKMDTAKVSSYLAKIVPTGTAGGSGGLPGQGRYQQTEHSKAEAGAAEAERRGFKPASGKSNLLPSNN